MRHVLLEGPDCSGKTTFAQHLEEDHGYLVRHEGPPPPGDGNLHDYYRQRASASLIQYSSAGRVGVCLDRSIHSEMVYGDILRSKPRVLAQDIEHWTRWWRAQGGITVLFLPPYETCHKLWYERADRGEELVEKERLYREVWEAYRDIRKHVERPWDVTMHGWWDDPARGFPCQVLCRAVPR